MTVVKRSVSLHGHSTSVSLEPEFWEALQSLAKRRGRSVNALIADIDSGRLEASETRNLSSAIRVFVLNQYRAVACSDH